MPCEIQLSVSKAPPATTSTPETGTPSAWLSRKVSLRTQSATERCRTAAPLPCPSTSTPSGVQSWGTVHPPAASCRSVPALAVTEKSAGLLAIHGLPAPGLLADLASEVETLERELDGARPLAVVAGREAFAHVVVELRLAEDGQPGQEVARRDLLAGRHHLTGLDPVDQEREVETAEVVADGLGGGGTEQVGEDLALATLLAGLELDLAAEHLDGRLEVDDPGHGLVLALTGRPVERRRGHGLGTRDGEAGADTGALVDRGRLTEVAGEARQDLDQVVGHLGDERRLLADHGDLVLELRGVVGPDLGPESVLQRGDDPTAVGVVLRVRAGHHEGVERQPQDVAPDLDVALLHHVEHRDLDPLGEVGQLVDRDDSSVAARDQAEVDRLGVTEVAALGHLHRVDVADQVGDGRVGCGELLRVPLVAVPPLDRQLVAELVGP